MPCSQMMSMNISPPRPMADRKLARVPAVKARMRNSGSRNIGSATRRSMMENTISRATPRLSEPITTGLIQPMLLWP